VAVAVDRDRPPAQHGLAEAVVPHVGPLSGAVDGEVTQYDRPASSIARSATSFERPYVEIGRTGWDSLPSA
jgi:hypothetical protein